MGDFNADQLSSSNADAVLVRSICSNNALRSAPHGATHHTFGSDTWLDLCLIDCEDTQLNWKTESPFVDGHDLITATVQVFPSVPLDKDIRYRDFAALDVCMLRTRLAAWDWAVFHESASVNSMVECLCACLTDAIDVAVPVKTVRKSARRKPWFTKQIIDLVAVRDRLYRVSKRVHTRKALLDYGDARDQAHHAVEGARQNFFHQRLISVSDPPLIWKELRRLGVVHVSKTNHDYDAEALNEHFARVSFDASEPSVEEVQGAVMHFSTEAKGTDGVPKSVIAAALPFLTPLWVTLFNRSFSSSTFPSDWKRAVIVARGKVKNPTANEFRPIALLCFLAKVLEKLASSQVLDYLAQRSILDSFQTGFLSGHSTQTALPPRVG